MHLFPLRRTIYLFSKSPAVLKDTTKVKTSNCRTVYTTCGSSPAIGRVGLGKNIFSALKAWDNPSGIQLPSPGTGEAAGLPLDVTGSARRPAQPAAEPGGDAGRRGFSGGAEGHAGGHDSPA